MYEIWTACRVMFRGNDRKDNRKEKEKKKVKKETIYEVWMSCRQ